VEKKKIDLDGVGVRIVNVAVILQGIRGCAAKRRTPSQVLKRLELQMVENSF